MTNLALAAKLPTEQRLILSVNDDLLNALKSAQYGRPDGLGVVLDDAVRSDRLIDLKDFTISEKSIYSRSWIPSPWAVLRWSLRQAGILGDNSYNISGRLRQGRLVLVPALEDACKKVKVWAEQHNSTLTDRIWTREAFAKELGSLLAYPNDEASSSPRLSAPDLDILVQYLTRDDPILTSSATTIKLKSPASLPEAVTSSDESIANLKSFIANLTTQTTSLSTRITTLQTTASTALSSKNKAAALSALRSKKLAERQLTQLSSQLSQLEEVFIQIQTASDQKTIMDTLESSSTVLKGLNKQIGGVERVDNVMDTLRGEMEKTSEVQGVLNEGLLGSVEQDAVEGEVDEEFERMEREERERDERAENVKREREEEKEAQRTRERLAGIEGPVGHERMEQGSDVEKELSRSVDRMERMQLDDRKIREPVQEQ